MATHLPLGLMLIMILHGASAGIITSVVPSSGSFSGGYQITILGIDLGAPSGDVTAVVLAGVAATVVSSNETAVIANVQPSGQIAANRTGSIACYSSSAGESFLANAFVYATQGISFVTPSIGSYGGGNRVTISGVGLGNGSDITLVRFLYGRANAVIVSQTAASVVVIAPASTLTNGSVAVDVFVSSRSVGLTVFSVVAGGYIFTVTDTPITIVVLVLCAGVPGTLILCLIIRDCIDRYFTQPRLKKERKRDQKIHDSTIISTGIPLLSVDT